ncbi:proline-rich protein 36 [Equus asinus]|uniref:proline-rich protein 36 n=1 Tax=Equus asinus TaxID=9793 RepID=UPI0038F5D4A7
MPTGWLLADEGQAWARLGVSETLPATSWSCSTSPLLLPLSAAHPSPLLLPAQPTAHCPLHPASVSACACALALTGSLLPLLFLCLSLPLPPSFSLLLFLSPHPCLPHPPSLTTRRCIHTHSSLHPFSFLPRVSLLLGSSPLSLSHPPSLSLPVLSPLHPPCPLSLLQRSLPPFLSSPSTLLSSFFFPTLFSVLFSHLSLFSPLLPSCFSPPLWPEPFPSSHSLLCLLSSVLPPSPPPGLISPRSHFSPFFLLLLSDSLLHIILLSQCLSQPAFPSLSSPPCSSSSFPLRGPFSSPSIFPALSLPSSPPFSPLAPSLFSPFSPESPFLLFSYSHHLLFLLSLRPVSPISPSPLTLSPLFLPLL